MIIEIRKYDATPTSRKGGRPFEIGDLSIWGAKLRIRRPRLLLCLRVLHMEDCKAARTLVASQFVVADLSYEQL